MSATAPPFAAPAATRIQESFLAAVAHHRRGELAKAEPLYREVLDAKPSHADALHLWGVLRHQQGHSREAIAAIRRALALNRASAVYLTNLAAAHRALKEFESAANCYRAAIAISPESREHRLQLAGMLRALTRHGEAAEIYLAILVHDPRCLDAQNGLGNALQEAGRLDEAITAYERALVLAPESADVLNNLAGALKELGRIDESIQLYQRATEIAPGRSEIFNNLGLALRANGESRAAIAALQRALQLSPADASAHHNLGNVYKDLQNIEQATRCYEQTLACDPDCLPARTALAAALEQNGDIDEAASHLAHAIRQKPLARWRIRAATLLPPIYASKDDLTARRQALVNNVQALLADRVTLDAAKEAVPLNFYLAYQGYDEAGLHKEIGRLTTSSHRFRRAARPDRSHKIRVGFLSRYFREHTVGRLFQGIIAGLSRSKFDVTLISVGRHQDAVANFLRSVADRFVVIGDEIPAALDAVSRLKLDVLFYTDLGMEPVTWTMAHSRLAPVQCVTWGHPLTTGLPTVDYFLSSRLFESDEAANHYTEWLVQFESCGICYERPRLSTTRRSRADFGLPENRRLYGCPQSLFKIHPDFDAILKAILELDPRGEIVLLGGVRAAWESALRRRFERTIGNTAARIRFVPRMDHAAYLAHFPNFDVLLDPIHFCGGHTSLEAIACGVPIVTLPSPFLRGRITAGLYRQMGLSACIVENTDQYVEVALQLAQDRDFRHQIEQHILERAPVLFDDAHAVQEVEQFLIRAVESAEKSV